MQRDLSALNCDFDVLVIGGGVYGACLARTAARNGFTVALVERDDFGGAVSHNSLKIVHGGFRYIQHFDLPRIWESVAAQRAWVCAAPHLIRPMRCVIPAYGHGTRGPVAFAAGICAFHSVAFRRNVGVPKMLRLPPSGVLSRRSLLSAYPHLDRSDLTGGAYWYDAQMLDANRLTLECLQDACDHGATIANHIDVLHLRTTDSVVEGAIVRDKLTGRDFEIRARVTVNATGPSVESLLSAGPKPLRAKRPLVWTRNVNIVTRKLFPTDDAVGVGSQRASDAAIGKSKRLFFVTPWQDCSVIGTSHTRIQRQQDDVRSSLNEEIEDFLAEVNGALPDVQLTAADVRYVHSGLTPAENDVARAKRSTVIDHEQTDGTRALITVLGIKYTTAPVVAESVMPILRRLLKKGAATGAEFWRPLPGSVGYQPELSPPADRAEQAGDLSWATRIYGARSQALLSMLPSTGLSIAEHVFRCRVLYGIKNEMVMRLRDATFRATDLAERGNLTMNQLDWCADVLAGHFAWSETRRQAEVDEVKSMVRLQSSDRTSQALFSGSG